MVAAGTISDADARQLLEVWRQFGMLRYDAAPLLDRVWELHGAVTAYTALYIALAENLGCALVTADARLAGANGPRCVISVVHA
jgi:predicted nucleic acid-binding protein